MIKNQKNNIDDFLSYIQYERGYSKHTTIAYKNDLNHFINYCRNYISKQLNDFSMVDRKMIRQFLGHEYEQGRSPKTVSRRLATLKSFYKYLVQAEIVSNNPTIHVKTPKVSKNIPTFVQERWIATLMDSPDTSTLIGLRDKAIIELFYATGVRLSELVALNIGSVDPVTNLLKVMGKGRKERIVPFGDKAKNSIEHYLNGRQQSWMSNQDTPLFFGRGDNRISVRTVARRMEQYLKPIVGKDGASPHTLRHTFGTHLLDNDADIRVIQELLGHSSISSTQIYTKVNPKKMKEIYKIAHPHGS